MKIQIGKHRVVVYQSCSSNDLIRMGLKPDDNYNNFYYFTVTHCITEEKLFSQVIGYDYETCEPILCCFNNLLNGLQVISDNKFYHFSFLDTKKNFVIELLTPVIAILPTEDALFVIHEVGAKKVSLAGNEIWDITTNDSIKNFKTDAEQKYLLVELYDSSHVKIQLSTGHVA